LPRVSKGRCETGEVFEPTVRLSNDDGAILFVRRITVEWDQPTRDGDRTIPILTHLPAATADVVQVAARYRKRWTLETAFQELEASLHGAINTRGDPKAALFAFGLALVAYNVPSTVKAALRSVHGAKAADTEVSGHDLAEEVSGTHRGMVIAVPKDEWVVFHGMSPREISPFPKQLARAVRLSEYRKQPRGPKRPRPKQQSGAKIKHVATTKRLEEQKAKSQKRQN
jgi:hypothetical protein